MEPSEVVTPKLGAFQVSKNCHRLRVAVRRLLDYRSTSGHYQPNLQRSPAHPGVVTELI